MTFGFMQWVASACVAVSFLAGPAGARAAGGEAAAASGADAAAPLFPFVLPWDDATPGVANISGWLSKPAGKFGHVRAGSDGHLYAGEGRIRFFGVDLAFSANIPTHVDAEKVASRLAKFGINIVRFHIMDMRRFPEGILARDAADTTTLDPEALDRLDYFIAQLARNGIYANLCLLNYRPINAADGLPPAIAQADDGPYQRRHVVGFFDDRVVDVQKRYARNLLTHRNAYTGRTYSEEPAVALVEVNNEDGLIHAWLSGGVERLADGFRDELRTQWNQWLLRRYGSSDRLRRAWSEGGQPVGEERLSNGGFARGTEGWAFECHRPDAEASASASGEGPAALSDAKSVELRVSKPGAERWHVRFQQAGLAVQSGASYTLSFWARAERAATLHVSLEQTCPPWHVLSGRQVELTPEWQRFRFVLPVGESDDRARLVFDPPAQTGACWIAGASLCPGGVTGLGDDEKLEDGSVAAFTPSLIVERSAAAQRDWMRFLWETECRYWRTMRDFVKDELGVRALLIGTVVGCSTPNLMAMFDCVDAHAYWQHPVFPGRPWDPDNWYVRNETMVNASGGLLPPLAFRRVLGKPFCTTEYGHPAPNSYVAEGHLLRAAYASLQDWDYTSASRYSHTDKWDLRCILNYFDIAQHPTKMVTLIPAAAMFLRGDVEAGRELVVASMDAERELEALRGAHAWELVGAGQAGVPRAAALVHRVALATEGLAVPSDAIRPEAVRIEGERYVSDTQQLIWDLSRPKRGVVTVNTSRSKAVIGFGGGQRYDLGGVVIEPGATRQAGWSAITVTAMDGTFAETPARLLITATGEAENTNMGWKNAEKSSVGRDWGEAPTRVEGIPAQIALPYAAGSVTAWPLDVRGQRRVPIAVGTNDAGRAVLSIGPDFQTLWYEVESR